MKRKEIFTSIVALILGVIFVLLIPFDEEYNLKTLTIVWSIIGLFLSFFVVVKLKQGVFLAIVLVLIGLTIAHIVRISIEVNLELSSHSLAGIEVIMANFFVIVFSLIGALIGNFFKPKFSDT